ncbi:mannose-1-phosphate guanyltransferase [Gloeocapsa sp. PCC 73106]|uniref:mannose-1-phosphate guanyltransferase n=1 Tax=Gloeocapsa sp. PCC 73106 TaxID=102232 RepID=UPI0002AC97AF|nr:mannose-1-phosphate guanyltransferase [Gloeocapsa sp. PCC 73106]ELR96350.1 Nucleoside-diphosphate-sugar pyrophosphorylase family protein [Gloeocapsa sp. PCC 73106]
MRAVLMAGGSGTRLRPLTCDLPKPMVPILNRPIAEHIINLLRKNGISEIIATLHYLPDIMREYFEDGTDFNVQITYSVEEEQPLGTAGCVKKAEELLNDTFLVISGDGITDFDLQKAIAFHREKGAIATLVLTRVPNPVEFGVVITNSDGRILRFLEKPSTSEIFSDTVNTGTYILEPEVLDYLPENQERDFSKDLFPELLAIGKPLYGYIAKGYWCDVGHLEAYRQSQYDALHQRVFLDLAYQQQSTGVWVGHDTYIDRTVRIEPPVIIGSNCRIGPRVTLSAGTVIGDNVTIGADAELRRPIIWNGVIIGEECHLTGCIIARGSRIDRRCQVLEGAVVGPLSIVGEEATINPGVRVWPSKRIEAGATLNINLIWGNTAQRNLFGQRGVSGLANIDITPEFAVKLGASYGSTLTLGASIVVSRDQRSVSRMVNRSLIAGLMSTGINVQNLEATAIPMTRALVPHLAVEGGIHVRVDPNRPDYMLIEFFDKKGINISKSIEKKIEGAYFKEDIRRVAVQDIGNMSYPAASQVVNTYSESFEHYLNVEAIRSSGAKIVIDYVYAVAGAILPQLLSKFGCDTVVLNASLQQTAICAEDREKLLLQLCRVVEALKANLGAQVSANGEQFILVDESGQHIRGELLTALMVNMILTAHPRGTVVIPVDASSAVEQIARRHDSQVIRTKANPSALMEASQTHPNVVLGGSAKMGFIFPQLHPGFDAMFSVAKVIEMLTIQERSLAQIRSELPRIAHRSCTIRCPSTVKGSLMRHLVETHPTENLRLIDGVKIIDPRNDNWILILPDGGDPLVHLYANSEERSWVDSTLSTYKQKVRDFIDHEHGID